MLDKLIRYRKVVFCVLASIYVVFVLLTLVFDNSDTKISRILLSTVLIFIAGGAMFLLYKIVMPNASYEVAKFFYCFFILSGTVSCFINIVSFIINFPCGLSTGLGIGIGIIVSSICSAKKELLH